MLEHPNAKIEMLTFTNRLSGWVVRCFLHNLLNVVTNGYTEVSNIQSYKVSKKSGSNAVVWIAFWIIWDADCESHDCAADSPWLYLARKPIIQSCRSDLKPHVQFMSTQVCP